MPPAHDRKRSRTSGKQTRATLKPSTTRNTSTVKTTPKSSLIGQPATGLTASSMAPQQGMLTAADQDREYGFIRSDLRRLLLTAAILIAVMIGLLLILE